MDRRWTFGLEHRAAVSVDGTLAFGFVLRTEGRERTESDTHAVARRAVHPHTLLWRAEDDRCAPQARLYRQSETSPATTATDGTGSDLSKTELVETRAWPPHLSIPAAALRHHAAQPGVVERYQCAAESGVGDERRRDPGLSHPACRSRVQTTASGLGQKPRS